MTHIDGHRRMVRATGLIGFLFASVADGTFAQDAPVDAGSVTQGLALEEVVVTAQKRSENIQVVPASVSVLGSEILENLSATQLADYVGYVPGLTLIGRGAPGTGAVVLRGIYTGVGSGGATVGVYVDDAPFGSSSAYGPSAALDLLPYDIERFEVLRGPHGTLYGAGSMGGLIKYVTSKPDLNDFSVRVGTEGSRVEGGDSTGWGARAGVNLPLLEGKLAARASYYYQSHPGFIRNSVTGQEAQNRGARKGGRLALRWAASESLSLDVTALRQSSDYDGVAMVTVSRATGQPAFGDLQKASSVPELARQDLEYYSATLNWQAGWGELVSASSYSTQTNSTTTDGSAFFLPVFNVLAGFNGYSAIDKFSQEIRLRGSPGRLGWLVGGFFTDESSESGNRGTPYTPGGGVATPFDPLLASSRPSDYEEAAVFGELQYQLTDAVDVTGGLRWSSNEQTFDQITGGFLANPMNPGARVITPGRSSDSVTTYSVSARYRFSPLSMLYARVASGYRPGGPNVALPGIPPSFDADTLTNYEVGFKSEFFGRRALFDASLFYIDWDDIQISAQSPSLLTYFANGGKATSQGIEVTSGIKPTQRLELQLSASYTDATLSQDVPSMFARAGDRVPEVARWSAAINASYEVPLGHLTMNLTGGYRYVGDRNYSFPADPSTVPFDSYGVLDLSGSLGGDAWTCRLFVRNATDERAYLNLGTTGPGLVNLTVYQPRTIGVAFDAHFGSAAK